MTFDPFCAPGGGGGGAAGVSEFALRMLAFLRRTGDSRIILGEKTARVEGVVVEGGVTEVLGVVFCSAGVVLGAGGGGGGGGGGGAGGAEELEATVGAGLEVGPG